MTAQAGPGRSISTASIQLEASSSLVAPDAIARRLNKSHPSRAAIPAAREAILHCRELLAGKGAMAIVRQAKNSGYRTFLVYVALGDPELHIERVRLRVSRGGHDIPEIDIRRRYWRSLNRAPEALRLVDEAVVLDNSRSYPVRLLLIESGRVGWRADILPEWAQRLSELLAQS